MRNKVVFCLLLMFLWPVHARTLAKIDFDEFALIPGYEQTLKLNGIGIRYKFFFKIYIAALYLEQTTQDAVEVIKASGAKRVQMHFLYDEVSREKLVKAWNEGFEENLSAAQLTRLSSRIEQFNNLFSSVVSGDVIMLDYVPDQGTRVMLNGVEQGVIQGEDFNQALLSIWLGPQPVGEDLKDALLGRVED